ncbi:MAG: IMP cyclohydrolase, partial [Oscillospiraceae bacterium]|nr:IMP cyclohydrolase [Oscillospiraceae bacterium]
GKNVRSKAFDESKVTDPSLIIYTPVRIMGNKVIVSNGDHTDAIAEFMDVQMTFEQALRYCDFESDEPYYTPRISGIVHFAEYESRKFNYALSIIKSANGNPGSCQRFLFSYNNPVAGFGHFIHTYKRDGEPLPSFEGEPILIETCNDIDEFTRLIWDNLDSNNKISLFTRFIDVGTGEFESRIINKYGK